MKENQYSIEDKSLERYKLMDKHLIGSDLILMLLSLSPIKGSTKMQKQVFLTWKELFSDVTFEPGFFPWRYGAFSKVIEDTLKILEKQNYIQIKRRKGQGSMFFITESGRSKIKHKMVSLGIDFRNLREKKTDWDEWSHKGILHYVYRKYPEYTSRTEVPHLKW
jgi:uncharacterized protein YwgA